MLLEMYAATKRLKKLCHFYTSYIDKYIFCATQVAMHNVLSVVCEELACCCCAPSTSTSNHKMPQHTYTSTYGGFFSKPAPKSRARPTRNIETKRCGFSCLHCTFSFFRFGYLLVGWSIRKHWKATSKRSHYKKKRKMEPVC